MPKEYTREQFWKLYEKLPQELKDAVFAEETGDNISDICERNGVGEKLGDIVDNAGAVLIGVLPPEDFQNKLEKDLEIQPDVAKKVAQEIYRFIFYPVKPALDELYKIGGGGKEKSAEAATAIETERVEEKPAGPPRKDTYREMVE